jgi:hypothetical protein
MFVRFVIAEIDEESHREVGVFHAAAKLRDDGMLSDYEEADLQEIRDWFNRNLEKPTRFTSAKRPYYRKRQNGIAWFKDSAREHIGKMRGMIAMLENHDVQVSMIKADRPGYVVYEDEFQVVAVPYADTDL